uniref:Uncharacterized protein n=1 Tax=Litopenaeus vannamei majanivirus Nimav-1_LVa TaxID=2984273 RepID=A0A9C7CED5_9VIRU|nr:MAG: hypothetical protein [Litopenaeus vannamei majanivirus Nimav-1_LVa]
MKNELLFIYSSDQIRKLKEIADEISNHTFMVIMNTLIDILDYHKKSQSPHLSYIKIESDKIQRQIQYSLKMNNDDWQTLKEKMSGGSHPFTYERNINIIKMDNISLRLLNLVTKLLPFIFLSSEFLHFVSKIDLSS